MNTEPKVAAASSCEEYGVPLPLGSDCRRAVAEDRLRPASFGASAKREGPQVRSEGGSHLEGASTVATAKASLAYPRPD
jgi:hypothetical protein